MKRRIFLLFTTTILLISVANAQGSGKIKFGSINSIGWLKGASRNMVQAQSINGIRYKSFFGGIGVGLDNYYYKTIPVFVDFRKNILSKKSTPFVYVDLGISFPKDRIETQSSWTRNEYKAGSYYDIGAGYMFPLLKKISFSLAIGYSQKTSRRDWVYSVPREVAPYGFDDVNRDIYNYTFRRLSLKAGISF